MHDFKVLLTMIFFSPSSPPRCLKHQIKTMGPGAAFQEDNLPEGRTGSRETPCVGLFFLSYGDHRKAEFCSPQNGVCQPCYSVQGKDEVVILLWRLLKARKRPV